MRVTCHQCSAKYTISEEKLRHGVVRLKCKHCRALIVVQPDGSVSGGDDKSAPRASDHGAADRGSDAGFERSSANDAESVAPAIEASTDGAETIPLPSFEDLGLARTEHGAHPALMSPGAAPGLLAPGSASVTPAPPGLGLPAVPAPPQPRVGSLTPLTPPVVRRSYAPGEVAPSASRPGLPLSGPPSVRQLQTADLDDERPQTAPPKSAAGAGKSRALLKRIPIKPEGWAVIVGVFILGLLLGALIAPNYERPRLVFNQASAGDAIRDAALQARHCFARPVPALVGSVEAEFAPSGEVAQLNIGGGLLHVDEHRCIQDAFSAMHVPPFDGEPVKAKKTVSLSLDP